jgi:hypothetical protein
MVRSNRIHGAHQSDPEKIRRTGRFVSVVDKRETVAVCAELTKGEIKIKQAIQSFFNQFRVFNAKSNLKIIKLAIRRTKACRNKKSEFLR